jgi:hypothetical protein
VSAPRMISPRGAGLTDMPIQSSGHSGRMYPSKL